ncbi:MAG: flagellar M-ring protein FliF [Pseudomonadales bacterium]|nr:flagellar M-ring protein FliF [Pseudomonadales bacterium]MCP5194410.1 flagellar M-ring protein FliF [Pseudomonadales bacterium]
MAIDPQQLLNRFSAISRQPATRQLRLLLGLAASIALGIGLVQWAMTPDFTPLYGELSPASAAEIIQSLERSGVSYKVSSQSGIISVPSDVVREMRLKLAGEGLPQGHTSGFDALHQEQQLGVSSFMEKARFDRALEQELSSSIASLDSVKAARVHLALPAQSAFVRKKNKPAASVLVSLYPGRQLTENQLAGIVHLVAFSVPGLEADQVSVVDNQGKLLSSQGNGDEFASTKENFRYSQQLEQSYVNRITEILTPILGVGAVRAQVAAELDFTIVESTSERYEPEKLVRSEQLVEELTTDGGASGVPGTLSNQPPPEPVALNSDGEQEPPVLPSRSSKREVRNFELDKTISHTRETPGAVKKLSVAVVVDYLEKLNDEGEVERVPLSEERLAEITALVKEAVGFNSERGDRVNVVNASFVAPPEFEPMPAPTLLEQEWVWRSGKFLLVGVSILATILIVLRPLLQASPLPAAGTPALAGPGGTIAADGSAMAEDRVTLGYQQNAGLIGSQPAYQQQLNMARSMVEGEPERVAHVVKSWVAADG